MAELVNPAPGLPPGAPPRNLYPRGKARTHSRLVHVLRWVLPMIMVGMVALLVGLVIAHAARRREDTHRDAATPIEMINPHFYGRDNLGRAYALGARRAARDQAAPQMVSLSYPSMTLYSDGPHPSVMTADAGLYQEDTHVLYLKGHVLADNAKSAKFATDEAVVDTRTGMVTSPTALSSHGPMGDLRSNGFDVFDKGDKVIFKGGVHARLNQQ